MHLRYRYPVPGKHIVWMTDVKLDSPTKHRRDVINLSNRQQPKKGEMFAVNKQPILGVLIGGPLDHSTKYAIPTLDNHSSS